MRNIRSKRLQVVRVARSMHAHGFVIGSAGNVSMRVDPDRFLITPTRTEYHGMRARDTVLLDTDGYRVRGGRTASRESQIHAAIYRARADIGAIVHTHSPAALAWSFLGRPLRLSTEDVEYFRLGSVPLVDHVSAGSAQLASAAATALGDDSARAILLERHGVVGTGRTAAEALTMCQVVEQQAWIALHLRPQRWPTPDDQETLFAGVTDVSDTQNVCVFRNSGD